MFHDAVLGASDHHANFKEGDTVTVERSTDGSLGLLQRRRRFFRFKF